MDKPHTYSIFVATGGKSESDSLYQMVAKLISVLNEISCPDHWLVFHHQVSMYPRSAYLRRLCLGFIYHPPKGFFSCYIGSRLLSLVFRDVRAMKEYVQTEDQHALAMIIECLPKGHFRNLDEALNYCGDVRNLPTIESRALRSGVVEILVRFQPVDLTTWVMVKQELSSNYLDRLFNALQQG